VLVLAGFGWLGWLWYRSSSFVKVERVTVTGLSGPDVPQIRDALTGAARQMTTLHMNISKLEASVSDYAYVQRLTVTRRGAHDVVIRVSEQVPVALVETAGDTDIVNADGQLMPSGTSHGRLPVVPVKTAPVGTSVSAPGARAAIAVLAAAPYALLSHVTSATSSSAHGVIVQLRSGPQLYFGPNTQLAQKWTAALAVLRSKYAAGASYIDLSDPRRPAPGVTVTGDQAEALGLATGGTSTTGESSGSTSGDASQSGADTASAEG
jgi:cell division septal protein FtsQ